MGRITVQHIWEGMQGLLVAGRGPGSSTFARAAIDSRDVRPDDLFFAIKGERSDGHDYVA